MRKLAHWCVQHRRIVVAIWAVSLVALSAIGSSVGTAYKDSFKLSGTDSFDAINLLKRSAPKASGDREQVVFAVKRGSVRDAGNRAAIEQRITAIEGIKDVASVGSPFAAGAGARISKDGQVAFADLTLVKEAQRYQPAAAKKLIDAVRANPPAGVQIEVAGQVAQVSSQSNEAGSSAFGLLAALIVLLLVFGSFLAAVTPILTAGLALGVGLAVTGLLSHLIGIATWSSQLSLLIGLGVGVDYALFIVSRMRQGIERGKTVEAAIVDSLDTSGRAVMFAGVTVCIALLGMFALGVSFLYGVAVSAAIAVAFTVVSALTFLPALLGFIGPRVHSHRGRRALADGHRRTDDQGGFWQSWSERLQRNPAVYASIAVLVLLALASPALGLRLGSADAGSDKADSTTHKAYVLLAKGFGPGFNGPLQLVAEVKDGAQKRAFGDVATAVGKTKGVVVVSPTTVIPGAGGAAGVAIAQVYPTGSPQDESTTALLRHLRDDVVPTAQQGRAHVLVGGNTAVFEDFATVLGSKLPLFIGVVVLLSFLLLTMVFRSLVIPAMAAVMNLLSIVAAFGVVTMVFQYGWDGGLLGIDRGGPIESFVPVMMFAILFGLSMDYEVFLVSRIYEEWHRTGDNRLAIQRGLAATGRTITAAAAIMMLVFGAFVLGGERVIELFGIGLAGAVFLDALIVRSVLVPSLMMLTGDANWKLPAFLDRILPHLNVEGDVDHDDDPVAPAVMRDAEPALR